MIVSILVSVLLCLGVSHGAEIGIRNYGGYQVLRALPANEGQYQALVDLYNGATFDFWAGPSRTTPADIMVDPLRKETLEAYFEQNKIPFTIFLSDVGQ